MPAAVPAEWAAYGLQGISVRSLAATNDILCAGTQGAGVFCRLLNGSGTGTGWFAKGLAGVTVTWLWIDPLDPLVLFAAAGAPVNAPSLYRTTNGGQSWIPADHFPDPGGPTPRAYAVDGVPGSGTIFAAGTQVWVSHDLGQSWTLSSTSGGLDCLEISRANPSAIWSGGETIIFMGFTIRSLDGGATWESVWDSRFIGDNQTSDVAAHPTIGGLVLTGHEGFVLRTETDGATFAQVLDAPSRFFIDWDGGNPMRAYAAGSPNGGTCHAFVSRDLGRTWNDVTGTVLAPRTVFRLEADEKRTGVVYAATDNGVYRRYGGGVPICLDARNGIEAIRLRRGACAAVPVVPPPPDLSRSQRLQHRPSPSGPIPPIAGDVIAVNPAENLASSRPGAAPGPSLAGDVIAVDPAGNPASPRPGASPGASLVGDVIAVDPASFIEGDATLFMGEAECLANDADITLITLDTPDPAPGRTIAVLARLQDDYYYGFTSFGLGRRPVSSDCP